jgi:2-polyprenyl-3-methyl-5-hydroxy-6-metoxy-1,4-benzoquinol methylase
MKPITEHQSSSSIEEWPIDDLERVQKCPVCGSEARHQLYSGLTDSVFRCAPGYWSLYQCETCRSAYLDPRPTAASIGKAYTSYYTHVSPNNIDTYKRSLLHSLILALKNGYFNRRFGTQFSPSLSLGYTLIKLFPSIRGRLDGRGRNIACPFKSARLLDVGCGNGSFLMFAREAGWDVSGVDMDPKAVAQCKRSGLNVNEGGIGVYDGIESRFDMITLSHIIEHVYDPVRLLKDCHRLLKPGGTIWVETPNLDGQGHKLYRHNWRGLEPPRHLVLFTRQSLIHAMQVANFMNITDAPYKSMCKDIFRKSQAIAEGKDAYLTGCTNMTRLRSFYCEWKAYRNSVEREFVTIIGNRNSAGNRN